jgi:cyclopropane fatty-acyl-phospholipid synthase-like methyltransferase
MEDQAIRLNDYSWAYRSARVLHLANRLGLFTAITGEKVSLDQICKLLKTKPEFTQKLLIALCSMDLLKSTDGFYTNSQIAETYLVKGKPFYQGDMIAHSDYIRRYWENLENQIYIDPPADITEADEHHHFIMAMDNIASTGRAELFGESVDLTGRKNLLDVGGGPGSYSIAACRKYPQLKATVFDLPATTEIAARVIARDAMQDRVTVCTGDWDADDFGQGFDAVLFSNVLHGPTSNAPMKLKKAHAAMQEAGLLIVQEFVLNDEKTGPQMPALFNVMVGTYSRTEIIDVITQAGFTDARVTGQSEKLAATWITAKKT